MWGENLALSTNRRLGWISCPCWIKLFAYNCNFTQNVNKTPSAKRKWRNYGTPQATLCKNMISYFVNAVFSWKNAVLSSAWCHDHKYKDTDIKFSNNMQKYVTNKNENICNKIFSGFREIAIFVMGYFFRPHPVYNYMCACRECVFVCVCVCMRECVCVSNSYNSLSLAVACYFSLAYQSLSRICCDILKEVKNLARLLLSVNTIQSRDIFWA